MQGDRELQAILLAKRPIERVSEGTSAQPSRGTQRRNIVARTSPRSSLPFPITGKVLAMRKLLAGAALFAAVSVPLSTAVAAGTPQRSNETPPGLEKLLADPTRGILRAFIVTVGSNSRLQDVPVSP